MNFPVRLRRARKESGLSQIELGRRLGVSGQSVKEWEAGRSSPQFDRLKDISKVTGKPIAWFFLADNDKGGLAQTVQLLHDTVVELERVSGQVDKLRSRLRPVVQDLDGPEPKPWENHVEWATRALRDVEHYVHEKDFEKLTESCAKARWAREVTI